MRIFFYANIQELGVSRRNSDLVRAMVSMTQDLGMEAIAEGIETEAQLQELKNYGW